MNPLSFALNVPTADLAVWPALAAGLAELVVFGVFFGGKKLIANAFPAKQNAATTVTAMINREVTVIVFFIVSSG